MARQGTTLETIRLQQELRRLQQQQLQPGLEDLSKLPADYVQTIIKNNDGSYSVQQ